MLHESVNVSAGIFLLDLNAPSPEPVSLQLEGLADTASFHPHGAGHWVGPDGSMFLYVISHRGGGDTVEAFEYKPKGKRLVHRKTFRDPLFHNLNGLVVVDLDQFYFTRDHYFVNSYLLLLETYLRLSLAYVGFFDGQEAMVASERLKYPNGIAKSNDGR